MLDRSRAFFGALAVALAGAGGAPAIPSRAPQLQVAASKKRRRGLFNGALLPYEQTLIGTRSRRCTAAQLKRASVKRRNQLRHKRAMRG